MSRRKRRSEEHDPHDRWLISYADFITLMFAFFVVMYAISSVNEGKYRVISDSLLVAFRSTPDGLGSAQISISPAAGAGRVVSVPSIAPQPPLIVARPSQENANLRQMREQIRGVAQKIGSVLDKLVKDGQVRIVEGTHGITIDINASVLFLPGDARLNDGAAQALSAVARILAPTVFPITVEGHTDNIPIANPQFPSNWELSGARASSVVRLMIDNGVAASRLTATGYADQRPVADNHQADGRSRNRRVSITVDFKNPDERATVLDVLQNTPNGGKGAGKVSPAQ